MKLKSKVMATAALGAALAIGTASAAFAEGPHYPTSQGAMPGNHGVCAYNWVQADTLGFPGWHGKHVFVSGMTAQSFAMTNSGCHPHVKTTYVNTSGKTKTATGKVRSNGALESALYAGNYKSIKYTDIWVETSTGHKISGTQLRVSPRGKVISKH